MSINQIHLTELNLLIRIYTSTKFKFFLKKKKPFFFLTLFRCCAMLSWSTNNCNMKNSKILWVLQSSARMFHLQNDIRIQNKRHIAKYISAIITHSTRDLLHNFFFFCSSFYNVICRKSPCNPSNATMCRD